MIRLALLFLLFLLSLLVLFRAPTYLLWYVSILVTEFSWIFIVLVVLLLCWPSGQGWVRFTSNALALLSLVMLLIPYIQAWQLGKKATLAFNIAFRQQKQGSAIFNPLQVFSGLNKGKVPFQTFIYDSSHGLTLDFYPTKTKDPKPCLVIIHGGAWAAGDNRQLPELNSLLANEGYHVASIRYRLAPRFQYPAPLEDVGNAMRYLKKEAAALSINPSQFVLLGRSAGGQIALSAAYTLHDPSIRGVINFYGPTDMVWGYENPTNPLVLDSRKVMEDYLGGSLQEVPQQYIRSAATETVTTQTPPTLQIFGENDPMVSPRHGTRLSVKLKAMNIPHFTLYLPWATHGFDYTLNGPGGQLSTAMVKHFLGVVLKK